MKFPGLHYLAALSATTLVFATVWLVDRTERQRFWESKRADVIDQLSITRARLEGSLNQRLYLTKGLVAYISANNPDITQAEFESLIGVILAQQPGVPSAALFKNSVATHLYPLKGQEEALGFEPMKIPQEKQAFETAIKTRRTVLAGPVPLVAMGSVAFITRTPIFLTPKGGTPESGAYWGIVSIGIDRETLFEEAGLLDPRGQLQYAIQGKDGLGKKGEIFWGDEQIFRQKPVISEVTLPVGSWRLAAIPKNGWPTTAPLSKWLWMGGSLLAILTGILVFKWIRDPAKLQDAVAQATKALKSSEFKYRELVENANSIILRINSQGQIIFFNEFAQSFFGYSENEIVGKSIFETIFPHPDTSDNHIVVTEQKILQHLKQYLYHENQTVKRNGERVWIAWRNKPLLEETGEFTGILAIGTDISDRKKAELALQQAYENLEMRVIDRTAELMMAMEQLREEVTERKHALEALGLSEKRERERALELEQTILKLQHTQAHLIQTEKMSSLGQLVAGIAHEINNPVNFIYGNLSYFDSYAQDLVELIHLYQEEFFQPSTIIQDKIDQIDLDFIQQDFSKLVSSMKAGTKRIQNLVQSLRNFSRLDESQMKEVDIHQGIDSTLMLLQCHLNDPNDHPLIQVIKDYEKSPKIECYAGQLNQVFLNILSNAIEAINQKMRTFTQTKGLLIISTKIIAQKTVLISITDNGMGMTEQVKSKIFHPFFTTKSVGSGTGLGLYISYQIVVEQHQGKLEFDTEFGGGTTFNIKIPIQQKSHLG